MAQIGVFYRIAEDDVAAVEETWLTRSDTEEAPRNRKGSSAAAATGQLA